MDNRDLATKRRAIRPLLDERDPADAAAAYYAFYHADNRTRLFVYPSAAARARGYAAVSRTGIDLFRPLVTLRLPEDDLEGAADLMYEALSPQTAAFIHAPLDYSPLLHAFFEVQSERSLYLYRLDRRRFEPEINVLVTRSDTPDGLPRFVVRPTHPDSEGEIGASATVNWQSPHFAEVAVYTNPTYRKRGWGRSVVSSLVQHLLESGRTPLYEVTQENRPSIQLARTVGFMNTGAEKVLLEGTLRSRP